MGQQKFVPSPDPQKILRELASKRMEKHGARAIVRSLETVMEYLQELQNDEDLDRKVNAAYLASKGDSSFSVEAAAAIQKWCGDEDTTIKETIATLTTIKGFLKALYRL